MDAAKPAQVHAAQPQGAVQMDVMNPAAPVNSQQQIHEQHAHRMRGGGAARDCFLGIVECFMCFECCKGLCECFADIICCPCEACGM
ncbi:hypothetical protein BV25DRAFT_1823656 [Artomyces pyxidatus]|uniref:Uncharacterized protein n=1 Tax=Artomyces pyxidatus TaxID=48021 RepID=A0ACB8T5S5_9AGAM|nr:hypothetical protein BV25DRAFT_1823656 [Artomyces pyxidatus]